MDDGCIITHSFIIACIIIRLSIFIARAIIKYSNDVIKYSIIIA